MIPLIPYRRFEFVTALDVSAATAQVAAHLRARRSFWERFTWRASGFEGGVTGDRFQFSRIVGYGNSFLPVVRGRIRAEPGGSRIEVTMTMHPFVMLFLVLWGVGFGAGAVSALAGAIQRHTTDNLIVVAILPIAYLAITLAFGIEALTAERFVREILPARPPN